MTTLSAPRHRVTKQELSNSQFVISTLETQMGWLAIAARDGVLTRVMIGHPSADRALHSFIIEEGIQDADIEISDWNPELRDQLKRYAEGEPISFEQVQLVWPQPLTSFRRRVIAETRRIPWGQTLTYGELAARSGSPRAARAVGTVMSSNRFPFIVPCHRVVGSAGGLGGFTAPGGIGLKERLLSMELGSDLEAYRR